MKPRTRTLGVIGATLVTAGLVLGLSFTGRSAATGANQTTPTTVSIPLSQTPDMGSIMTGDHSGMAAMMGSTDMSAMHSMMHQMMKGSIDDEALALLICPLAMGIVMWLLMRQPHSAPQHAENVPHEEHAPVGPR